MARVILLCNGLLYRAARRLRCCQMTIENYRKKYPQVAAAIDKAKGLMGDLAEQKLYDALQKDRAWAICFYLKTQCRNRGYIERQEVYQQGEVRVAGQTREEVRADVVKRLIAAQEGRN
jgi:hypothetical protein